MGPHEMLHLLQTQTPMQGVRRVHTFKGSTEHSTRDITIEISDWGSGNQGKRFHIESA